jgi:hypothetical protein
VQLSVFFAHQHQAHAASSQQEDFVAEHYRSATGSHGESRFRTKKLISRCRSAEAGGSARITRLISKIAIRFFMPDRFNPALDPG